MAFRRIAAAVGVASVATASVVLADVTPTTTTDEATPRPARTETAKRGYVPLFTKKNVEEVEFSRRQKIARLPEPQDDDRRSSNRTKSLSYVSSLGNMLMDISRDEGASGFMDMAVEEACEGIIKGEGGPFGAVIVQDGLVVARAHNTVLQTNDPTAHAEVTCIRKAAARLGRFDLSDCVLYTSCYPCPMCFGAMHWAKIPECHYAATAADAAAAGFDDQFIYDAIRGIEASESSEEATKFVHSPHSGAVDVFKANYSLY